MLMKIVQAPDPVLSSQAKPVKKLDKEIVSLIKDMKATLLSASDPEGVGLAAPQVGESLQLFLIKEDKDAPFSVFINPKVTFIEAKVTHKSKKDRTKLEGCLSLKDIWGTVERAPKVEVEYIDEAGQTHHKTFSGFFATIIQHEYDHLQGVLFPRRVLEQNGKLYKSHKDKDGEDVFDLIEL